jgi:isatin hydrolase
VVFVEGLTGLRHLPARGAWFLFLPIRLAGGTGGPAAPSPSFPAIASPPDKYPISPTWGVQQ